MSSSDRTVTLCRLDEISDPGGKGFNIMFNSQQQEIFVIRSGEQVFGYINSCPHTGVCLDWQPDQFLTNDKKWIVCAMHGAQFRIEDGYCVTGPCSGDALTPVEVRIEPDTGLIQCISTGSDRSDTDTGNS